MHVDPSPQVVHDFETGYGDPLRTKVRPGRTACSHAAGTAPSLRFVPGSRIYVNLLALNLSRHMQRCRLRSCTRSCLQPAVPEPLLLLNSLRLPCHVSFY